MLSTHIYIYMGSAKVIFKCNDSGMVYIYFLTVKIVLALTLLMLEKLFVFHLVSNVH